MTRKKLSEIAKELAKVILRKRNASPEAVGLALKLVQLAWNLAHDDYKEEPAYTYGIEEIQRLLSPVAKELMSENAEYLTEVLMKYKLKHYASDRRLIFSCKLDNGSVKVIWR